MKGLERSADGLSTNALVSCQTAETLSSSEIVVVENSRKILHGNQVVFVSLDWIGILFACLWYPVVTQSMHRRTYDLRALD
jgi:hypothetical protein